MEEEATQRPAQAAGDQGWAARVPPAVQPLLSDFLALADRALPGLIAGLYLHGSIALDAFVPGQSDVDYVAITSRRCTGNDIDALRAIHGTLGQRYPSPPLEGCYLEWPDLGELEATIPPRPFFHDGELHSSGYHDINGVTWWVLRHHGIAVRGPSVAELDIPVDWEQTVRAMRHNMNTYWASFTSEPRRMSWLLSDYGVQWAVLGVLRQFYSFREGGITSKIGAGQYALAHTPQRWHALIQEAIDIRAGKPAGPAWRRPGRAIATRAFLHWVIAECNAGAPPQA